MTISESLGISVEETSEQGGKAKQEELPNSLCEPLQKRGLFGGRQPPMDPLLGLWEGGLLMWGIP